jgi:hypothetical protein
MNPITLIEIIWTHFIADFLLQTNEIAINKSSCNMALGKHTLIIFLCFLWVGWQFALINAITHFVVDYITSRIAKYFHNKEMRGAFFKTIGADQAIHFTIYIILLVVL